MIREYFVSGKILGKKENYSWEGDLSVEPSVEAVDLHSGSYVCNEELTHAENLTAILTVIADRHQVETDYVFIENVNLLG